MIETVSSATLNGVTISGGSTYTASNGSTTTLLGTIVNDGEISVDFDRRRRGFSTSPLPARP